MQFGASFWINVKVNYCIFLTFLTEETNKGSLWKIFGYLRVLRCNLVHYLGQMIRLITANFDITEGTNKGFSSLESGGLKHTSAPTNFAGGCLPQPPASYALDRKRNE